MNRISSKLIISAVWHNSYRPFLPPPLLTSFAGFCLGDSIFKSEVSFIPFPNIGSPLFEVIDQKGLNSFKIFKADLQIRECLWESGLRLIRTPER